MSLIVCCICVWGDTLHCSRKRGPLSGAGFLCARDEASFLAICQAASPLAAPAPVAAPVTTATVAAPATDTAAVCFLPGKQMATSSFALLLSTLLMCRYYNFANSPALILILILILTLIYVWSNRRKHRRPTACVHCILPKEISREGKRTDE